MSIKPITINFTIIIAVYNGEKTIKKAIQSIIDQTYAAYEIIIVDDGSTDNTKNIITPFSDKVHYIYQQNSGVAAARNKAVAAAQGEWLCFLDADDWYYPNRLQWHADLIKQDPELDFLTGNFDYINEQGMLTRQSMQPTTAGQKLLQTAGNSSSIIMQGDLINDFIAQHFGDTHTLSLPRATFNQLGGYPEGVAVCEDVHFLIRLCAISKKIGVITQPMAAYFIHSESATRSNPLRAQLQSVSSLVSLKSHLKEVNPRLLKGLKQSIRHARLDLSYTLIKMNKRVDSVKAVLPLFYELPGFSSIRDILSIIKG